MLTCINLVEKISFVSVLASSSGIAKLDELVGYNLTAIIGCECFIRVC